MKRSVTRFIRYSSRLGGNWSAFDNGRLRDNAGSTMLLPLPRRSYRVRYSVAPDGKYQVWENGFLAWRDPKNGKSLIACVCFLPPEWEGLRVRRQVIKQGRK